MDRRSFLQGSLIAASHIDVDAPATAEHRGASWLPIAGNVTDGDSLVKQGKFIGPGPSTREIFSAQQYALRAEAARQAAQDAALTVNVKNVDLAQFKELDTAVTTLVFLAERGRLYQWHRGNFATEVAADKQEAIFIKSNSVEANFGAWVCTARDEVDVFLCGARYGSGIDARPAVQAALELAHFLGVPAAINGEIYLNSGEDGACCELFVERNITLIIRGRVVVGPDITTGKIGQYRVFRFVAAPTINPNAIAIVTGGLVYGTIDMSSAPSGTLPGVDAISMTGIPYQQVSRLLIDHGVSQPMGDMLGHGTGGDSSIFLKDYQSCRVQENIIIGSPDLGLYLSGDNTGSSALNADVAANYFYRCGGGAIAGKRASARHFITRNTILECQNGIFGGTADDHHNNQGREWTVSNNDIRRTQGDPIRFEADQGTKIVNNTIVDFRCKISDGSPTAVRKANRSGGIKMNGCSECLISGNSVRFEDWKAPSKGRQAAYGVALSSLRLPSSELKCRRIKILQNDFVSVYGGIVFDGTNGCTGKDNDIDGMSEQISRYREISIHDQNFIWDDYDFATHISLDGGTLTAPAVRFAHGKREGRDFCFNIFLEQVSCRAETGIPAVRGLPFPAEATAGVRYPVTLVVNGAPHFLQRNPVGYIEGGASTITIEWGSCDARVSPTSGDTSVQIVISGRYRIW
jgi:hypothetical protein